MSRYTLAAPASLLHDVKHSKFLARAAPVADTDAALAWLRQVADPTATHNCWAFRIGDDYRSSDDGEPAGTAGRPILAAIDGQGCDRTMVVVTRWYGGIKLGAGGLVRAYRGAATECLRTAHRVPIIAFTRIGLAFDFADTGNVHLLLAQAGADKLDERFEADGVHLRIELPATTWPALQARLRNATGNRIRFNDDA